MRIAEKPERAEEIVLIGSAGGSRLAVQGLGISWFAQNPQGRSTSASKDSPGDSSRPRRRRRRRLPAEGPVGLDVHAEASLTVGLTLLNGFTVQGSGQLAIDVSTHADLGPVQIDSLRLAIAPADDQIGIDAGVVLACSSVRSARSSRTSAFTRRCGFSRATSGRLDIDTSFKPPVGVGLSIEAALSPAADSCRSIRRRGSTPARCSWRCATCSR